MLEVMVLVKRDGLLYQRQHDVHFTTEPEDISGGLHEAVTQCAKQLSEVISHDSANKDG